MTRNTSFSTDLHHFFEFFDKDLTEYTPVFKGLQAVVYVMAIGIVSVLIVLVQKAVYLTFKKLGNRHINLLILPYLHVMNLSLIPYLLNMIIRSLYYPVKDITGVYYCYYIAYTEVFSIFYTQFQTFFVTLYRYICLFHDGILIDLGIHPRTLAKWMAFSHFFTSLVTAFSIFLGSEPTNTEQSCLGNFAELYQHSGHLLCNEGSIYR